MRYAGYCPAQGGLTGLALGIAAGLGFGVRCLAVAALAGCGFAFGLAGISGAGVCGLFGRLLFLEVGFIPARTFEPEGGGADLLAQGISCIPGMSSEAHR